MSSAAAVAAGVLGVGSWWFVAGPAEATERGRCADSTYGLDLERDHGGVEVRLELQAPSAGQAWTLELGQGDVVLQYAERTTDEDGEIEINAVTQVDGTAVEALLTRTRATRAASWSPSEPPATSRHDPPHKEKR